jgi:hypothetical protein
MPLAEATARPLAIDANRLAPVGMLDIRVGFFAMPHRRKPRPTPMGARGASQENTQMVLSAADRDFLLAAIERKPNPAGRLVKALKRHRRLFG